MNNFCCLEVDQINIILQHSNSVIFINNNCAPFSSYVKQINVPICNVSKIDVYFEVSKNSALFTVSSKH